MTPESTDARFDRYIVARMALWAGDFDYFQKTIGEFAPRSEFGKMPDSMAGPVEVAQYSAALRSRQLSQKRGEFSKLVEALASDGMHVVSQPEILITPHLRGAVWRLGPRRFTLRAFLSDLDWESELFINAAKLLRQNRGTHLAPADEKPRYQVCSWLVPGPFVVEVVIGDLGLLEAEGVWSEIEREITSRDVLGAFQRILSEIDPSDARDSRDRSVEVD